MIKLTVLFDEPFWIGIFEKQDQDKIQICRVVFGHEPKDYEVYDFILKNYYNLKFSEPISIDKNPKTKINPKRMQRKIKENSTEKRYWNKGTTGFKT